MAPRQLLRRLDVPTTLIAAALVLWAAGTLSWRWLGTDRHDAWWSIGTQPAEPDRLTAALKLAEPHLARARQRSHDAVDGHLDTIRRFFRSAQRRTPTFATTALGWGSKWRLLVDQLPNSGRPRQLEYLRSRFEELVFSPRQVEQVVEQAIGEYLREVDSIESEMLVALRADLADFPATKLAAGISEEALKAEFERAVQRAMNASTGQLQADIGQQLVAIISAEVLTQVAVRLGVSAGILSTGAASGWATFGVGVVVGLIVDQLVARVWDWWSDPDGDLAHQLNQQLDQLLQLLCEGDEQVQGLRSRLEQLSAQRADVREAAIRQLLQTQLTGGTRP